jgi:uncharacterized ferritin-like protein (DUF455 family)
MELREFAEQILFATTLEEKLQSPGDITDERPGSPLTAPAMPGRPSELSFRTHGSARADFPGVQRLEQERERGRLLHFFGNHELLATELMALALLRFPDAPAAFRRGVLNTLKDEQRHTRLYMQRMKECGITFGELPVSGFFWRCASTMEHPMDYATTLCLTFEQANLDFARHFAASFAQVGDAETARLLDGIYHDEIGHVAYGLKWFRRWKNPQQSDWEAFCSALKFPLSPQRAKGFTLNVEGRRAAGLDPDFIAALNVYSQSKGRTPSVYVFNPFAEARIAQGTAFTPARHQAQLAADLANLPQFLCRQDDLVLLARRPSVKFLSGIKQAGFALPEFVELGEAGAGPPDSRSASVPGSPGGGGLASLAHRKLGALRPWAWGPDSLELLQPLFSQVTGEARTASQRFNAGLAQLYSKAWSAEFLRSVLAHSNRTESSAAAPETRAGESWLCTEQEVGVAVSTYAEACEAIAAIRRRGHHKVVVKEALGLAGHNALRLWEPALLPAQRRWLERATQAGRQLIVEPWLEREVDFSVQLEMGPHGLKLCGYTGLINDRRGQFQANTAGSHHHRRLPTPVVACFAQPADIANRLQRLYGAIFVRLETELGRVGHVGPIGIDAFVYRTPEGTCRLKPVVEINPRYTMGRLTVELMKQTCPGCSGRFRLVTRALAQAEGCTGFPAFAAKLNEQSPLCLEGEPVPRIRAGALCLNDPAQAQICLAVFEVSHSGKALW